MTVLGNSAKPSYSYFAYDSTTYPNQIAERLTSPAQRIVINSLGCWIGGWNAAPSCVMAVWALDGTMLAQTAAFTVANEGAAGEGNTAQYVRDLTAPLIVNANTEFYVGVSRDRNMAAQWGTGTTSNVHYEARGAHPPGALGSVSGPTSVARRTGMYVADYQPLSVAWVRRGGAWVQATDAYVFRGGVWVPIESVGVLRGSTWVDAS
jgi:hypothetical protein